MHISDVPDTVVSGDRSELVTLHRDHPATVAVGTALAGGPPHRSQRAGLPHWAPASGSGGKAHFWERMDHAGGW